jgi:hypothetical protein
MKKAEGLFCWLGEDIYKTTGLSMLWSVDMESYFFMFGMLLELINQMTYLCI